MCPCAMSWCYIGSNLNHSCREMRLWQHVAPLSCCSWLPSHVAAAVTCLCATALAPLLALLCQSQGHPTQGDNQLSSCGAQRGYCKLPSPPLVLVLSLGGEQLPDVQKGKDSTIQSLPDLFKA